MKSPTPAKQKEERQEELKELVRARNSNISNGCYDVGSTVTTTGTGATTGTTGGGSSIVRNKFKSSVLKAMANPQLAQTGVEKRKAELDELRRARHSMSKSAIFDTTTTNRDGSSPFSSPLNTKRRVSATSPLILSPSTNNDEDVLDPALTPEQVKPKEESGRRPRRRVSDASLLLLQESNNNNNSFDILKSPEAEKRRVELNELRTRSSVSGSTIMKWKDTVKLAMEQSAMDRLKEQRQQELQRLREEHQKVRSLTNHYNVGFGGIETVYNRKMRQQTTLSQSRYQLWNQVAARPLSMDFFAHWKPPVYEKSVEDTQLIHKTLSKNFLLQDDMKTSSSSASGNNNNKVQMLIDAMEQIEVNVGDVVTKQGDIGEHYYIVADGTFEIQVDGKTIQTVTAGASFGEQNLLYSGRQTTTVVAVPSNATIVVAAGNTAAKAKLFRLNQQSYRGIMQYNSSSKSHKYQQHPGWDCDYEIAFPTNKGKVEKDDDEFKTSELDDWEKITILHEGDFGDVWMVQDRAGIHSTQFALKSRIRNDDDRHNTIHQEVSVLKGLRSNPFICNLIHTYEDDESSYMLMGLLSGGELWDLVHNKDDDGNWSAGLGSEETAKLYAYVIADTLGYMHSKRYIYRGLKCENVILDGRDGYPVLVDFGFAKQLPSSDSLTYTFCGTPSYVCPEIIKNSGHNAGVDHWQLGVLIYEMMSGENPFYYEGVEQMELFRAICEDDVYPLNNKKRDIYNLASEEVVDLINKLLIKDCDQRLGMQEGKTMEILSHEWFQDVDLQKLRRRELEIPGFVPRPILPTSAVTRPGESVDDNQEEVDGANGGSQYIPPWATLYDLDRRFKKSNEDDPTSEDNAGSHVDQEGDTTRAEEAVVDDQEPDGANQGSRYIPPWATLHDLEGRFKKSNEGVSTSADNADSQTRPRRWYE